MEITYMHGQICSNTMCIVKQKSENKVSLRSVSRKDTEASKHYKTFSLSLLTFHDYIVRLY